MRMRGDTVMRPIGYSPQIRGIVRINLGDALDWLGHGKMLGVHALFPPPYYDRGYDILLRSGIVGSRSLDFPYFSRHLIMSKMEWRRSDEKCTLYGRI